MKESRSPWQHIPSPCETWPDKANEDAYSEIVLADAKTYIPLVPIETEEKKLWERIYVARDRGRGLTLSRKEVKLLDKWLNGKNTKGTQL